MKFRTMTTQTSKRMPHTFTLEIPWYFEFNDTISFNFYKDRISDKM